MNKIMEVSEAVAKAYAKWWLYTPDNFTSVYYAKLELLRDALRAEIDSVEAELTHWKEARQSAIDAGELMKSELAALRAKVAEMEGQEPVAWMRQWSFNGEETGFELYGVYGDCKKDAVYHGGICTPLYLAPGAKP